MTGEVPPYQAVHGKMGNLGLPVRRETEHRVLQRLGITYEVAT